MIGAIPEGGKRLPQLRFIEAMLVHYGEVVFHRVPLECPLPDSEVLKTEPRPTPRYAELIHASEIHIQG